MNIMVLRSMLKHLALPPAINILGILLAILLWRYKPGLAKGLFFVSFITLWLMSTPMFSAFLLSRMERYAPVQVEMLLNLPQTAIVIMGGGKDVRAPEYGGETVSMNSLLRLRYGAWLYRQLEYPILVTGGSVYGKGATEADLIAEVLEQEFNVPVSWREGGSRTTLENVRNSVQLLREQDIRQAIVISSTIHLRRVIPEFEDAGFDVIPAPMNFLDLAWDRSLWLAFIPSSQALNQSQMVLHELLGRSVYRSITYWAE